MKVDLHKQEVTLNMIEAVMLFNVIEECQQFLHNPMHFENKEDVDKFAISVYPRIRQLYYKTFRDFNNTENLY